MKKMYKLLLLLLVALFITGCAQNIDNTPSQATDSGKTIPTTDNSTEADHAANDSSQEDEFTPYYLSFEATTIEGEPLTSDCFANSKLTMINVWATYCNPCLNEMPGLGEIAAEYDPAQFQMLGIICDAAEGNEENINIAKELIQETQANYPHLLLNQSLHNNLVIAVNAVPTTFFFTQEGELLGYFSGALEKEAWKELIDELLADLDNTAQ